MHGVLELNDEPKLGDSVDQEKNYNKWYMESCLE